METLKGLEDDNGSHDNLKGGVFSNHLNQFMIGLLSKYTSH